MLTVKGIFADGVARPLSPVSIPDGQTVLITMVSEPEETLADDPLAAEEAAFVAMHPTLQADYLGEYVAIYQQALVDHDADLAALTKRVYERFGNTAVWISPVKEQIYEEWTNRSPLKSPHVPRILGNDADTVIIHPDFDDPLPDFAE